MSLVEDNLIHDYELSTDKEFNASSFIRPKGLALDKARSVFQDRSLRKQISCIDEIVIFKANR